MKNLILTGGFAAMLLLSACGNEPVQDEQVEAETTETPGVSEEVTEEATEEVPEEIYEQESITEIYGYNDEVVTEEADTLNVTRQAAIVMGMEVDSEMSWYFADEGYEIGDEVQMIALEYTVENTVEEQRDFYLEQTSIRTRPGQE